MKIQRDDVLVPVLAVGTAMLIGMLLLFVTGSDPFMAYGALLRGMFGSEQAVARTLINTAPLILAGLSVAIAFRAGLFNIGATGQAIMGILAGGAVAIHMDATQPVHIAVELVVATAAGAAWGALAGVLKAVRGAHEVITTIMLNYIAIRLGEYLLRAGPGGLLHEKGNANPTSPPFADSAGFPILWDPSGFDPVHMGIVVAFLVAAVMWFLIERTTLGYEIRAVGLNPDAAEYGGVSVNRTVVASMALAGGCAGLAGIVYTLGQLSALGKSNFAEIAFGFTGIAVALLGRSSPIGVIFAALLFGGLAAGGDEMQFSGGLESGLGPFLIEIVTGLVIFFVGADMLFRRFATRLPRLRARSEGAT